MVGCTDQKKERCLTYVADLSCLNIWDVRQLMTERSILKKGISVLTWNVKGLQTMAKIWNVQEELSRVCAEIDCKRSISLRKISTNFSVFIPVKVVTLLTRTMGWQCHNIKADNMGLWLIARISHAGCCFTICIVWAPNEEDAAMFQHVLLKLPLFREGISISHG